MSDKEIKDMNFEEAMAELEHVVGQLENGDVPLEKSISLYERGALLKKRCEDKLKEAEEKVSTITMNEKGEAAGVKETDGF